MRRCLQVVSSLLCLFMENYYLLDVITQSCQWDEAWGDIISKIRSARPGMVPPYDKIYEAGGGATWKYHHGLRWQVHQDEANEAEGSVTLTVAKSNLPLSFVVYHKLGWKSWKALSRMILNWGCPVKCGCALLLCFFGRTNLLGIKSLVARSIKIILLFPYFLPCFSIGTC